MGTTRVWPGASGIDRQKRHAEVVSPHEAPGELTVDDAGEERRHLRIVGLGAVSTPTATPNEDRILTVPNVITFVRLLCLPIYLWLLLGLDNRAAAAALLAVLGATDWVDGYIARHFNQVSNLGKVLDPVADRFLFFVGVGGILIVDGAPRWFSIIVLARELLVGAATVLLAMLGAKRIDVTWFGKAGTFGLMFAFPLFLWGSGEQRVRSGLGARLRGRHPWTSRCRSTPQRSTCRWACGRFAKGRAARNAAPGDMRPTSSGSWVGSTR